jgi:hypothetical protein
MIFTIKKQTDGILYREQPFDQRPNTAERTRQYPAAIKPRSKTMNKATNL